MPELRQPLKVARVNQDYCRSSWVPPYGLCSVSVYGQDVLGADCICSPMGGLGTAGSILHEAALLLLSEWNISLAHKAFSRWNVQIPCDDRHFRRELKVN